MFSSTKVKGHVIVVSVLSVLVGLVVIWYCLFHHRLTPDCPNGPRVKPTLRLVVIISRHGNRAPVKTYPKFPFPTTSKIYWPFGASQLTLRGRLKMYNLGVKIRALYNGFLDEHYYKEYFKAYSTNTERTMMSGELFLAGLFPPKGFQQWRDELMWQPVPVYHNEWDHSEDAENICPRYKEGRLLIFEKYLIEEGPNNTEFLKDIEPYTGLKIGPNNIAYQIYMIVDSIISASDEGLPLPPWAQTQYPRILLQRLKSLLNLGSLNTLKFMEGPLFQKIMELMEEKLGGNTTDQKMYYFSGHDKTIFGLMRILGIPVTTVINPGSSLILELHEDLQSGAQFIEVVYIDGNSPGLELSTQYIPGCEHPCHFDLVKNLTKKYWNFTDYIKDCQI